MAPGVSELLTQESEKIGTILVYDRNEFNEISCLKMLWTVQNLWMAGKRFALYLYKNWEQILLCQMGEPPVTLLIQ